MGIGQVLSDTFGMVKSRFGQLLALWAIYFAITMVLFVGLVVAIGATGLAGLTTLESNPLAAGAGMIVFVVLLYVGYLLVAMAQYASLISMASPLRQLNVGEALSAGWRAAPALLLLMLVLIIGYFVVAMAFGLVGAAFSALGDWGSTALTLLLLPVLVWIGCRLSPMYAVMAVDGVRNPFTAITRSWRLTRGYALQIFLAALVFIVILVVACGIALLPSIGLLRSMADPAGLSGAGAAAPAVGGIVLLMLGLLVVSVLFTVSYCALMAVIHGTLASSSGEGTAETFA